MVFSSLSAGDPAPWFRVSSLANPDFAFDTVAGRYIVLFFFGSSAGGHAQAAQEAVFQRTDLFNDDHASFFGVSGDPSDVTEGRIADRYPGYRYFADFDLKVARAYGAAPLASDSDNEAELMLRWVVVDPTLRIMRIVPCREDGGDIEEVLDYVAGLPPVSRFTGLELHAPVILLPQVFEPEFCSELIALYDAKGGTESGFMREVNGKTVLMTDSRHKRREDCLIEDQDLIAATQMRVRRRIVPEILKVHQFRVTRMERYLVACYAAENEAHFSAHRDNTTKGTAHRRFAVSINLSDDFDGGELSFPEYGPRTFRAPAGGAVVFSCSLLHRVSKVTRGRRFAFPAFPLRRRSCKVARAEQRIS